MNEIEQNQHVIMASNVLTSIIFSQTSQTAYLTVRVRSTAKWLLNRIIIYQITRIEKFNNRCNFGSVLEDGLKNLDAYIEAEKYKNERPHMNIQKGEFRNRIFESYIEKCNYSVS
jgi:hypothetical protein